MDGHKASCILEILLRKAVEGFQAGGSLGHLPIRRVLDPRLRKTILLRRLSSDLSAGDLSRDTLYTLELLEELDRSLGAVQTSESLKAAYCAVAAELTAAPLRSGSRADFFEAVNSIWNCRVGDLERSEARGMMGEGLREWRRRMEEAVVSDAAREGVVRRDTRGEAMEVLREYLRVALKETKESGPSQLELSGKTACGESGSKGIDEGAGEREATGLSAVSSEPNDANGAAQMKLSQPNRLAAVTAGEGAPLVQETETQERSLLSGRRETLGQDRILKELDFLLTPEVNRAKEALKSSLDELQKAVEDPLPNALLRASEVQNSMAVKSADAHDATKGQDQMYVGNPEPSIQMDAQATVAGRLAAKDCIIQRPTKPRPSLMDRNPTARIYEWDEDCSEVSMDNSPNSLRRPHLPTPSHKVSPLQQTQQIKKFVRRRKARRWSPQEEDALREAVKKHGKGNWKLILQHYRGAFGERTEVDLKDKWRNMTR